MSKKKDPIQEAASAYRMKRASRLRQIRKNSNHTQASFAELLDLTEGAYAKIERGERGLSLEFLEKLYTRLNISTDFILYGNHQDGGKVWASILNCTENDKLAFLLRLMHYFTSGSIGKYPVGKDSVSEKLFLSLIEEMQERHGHEPSKDSDPGR